jgi:agmatinase
MNLEFLFIPNWNGHLFLAEKTETSIKYLFEKFDFKNSTICKITKNNFEETQIQIEKNYNEIEKNKIPFCICGDHSNSYYLIKEFFKKNPNFNLVIFDAHPDCEIDTGIVSHEDYVRFLIEEKIVNPKNIYLIGIRTYSRLELEYLKKMKVNYFGILETLENPQKINEILKTLKNDIYLSIDIDVLDPDFAPATYYREYCGITITELIEFLKNITKEKIKSIDICEYYKEKENKEITENNILKLINFYQ